MSLMDDMYNKVNEVLGAGNQLFCMEFPARPLNPNRFRYDTSDRNSVLTKPYTVQEAEFRLSDELFNTAPIVQGSNGKNLSVVYDAVLNNYVPKLSDLKEFIVDKFDIRQFLLEKIEDEIDGKPIKCSRMEMCQRLYNKYLDEKNKWLQEKDARFEDYRGKDNLDGFAKWVSSEGMVRDESLNNLFNDVIVRGNYHEVLTILGFLNVASSAEVLEKTKQNMRHSCRKSLDSSMTVYPVQFQPNDWFKSLKSNFSPIDLLNSADAISNKYRLKKKQLAEVNEQLAEMRLLTSSPEQIEALELEVEAGKEAFHKAEEELMAAYGQAVLTAFKIYLTAQTGGGLAAAGQLKEKLANQTDAQKTEDEKLRQNLGLADEVVTQMTDTYSKQSGVLAASERLSNLRRLKTRADSKDYGLQLQLLTSKKNELAEEVEWLAEMLGGIEHSKINGEDAKTEIMPSGHKISDSEFTDIIIQYKTDSQGKSTSESSSASDTSWKVSAWFVSAGGNSSTSSAQSSVESSSFEKTIEIGMRVTKVSIDRGGWLNPAIFDISNAYHRLAEYCAGAGINVGDIAKKIKNGQSVDDLTKVKTGNGEIPCVLPSYPVSFVIAKDITIKITSTDSNFSAEKENMEKSAAAGGGFLGFSCTSSSSSSSASSDSFSSSTSDSLMMRIPGPQILGWFLQLTPEDKSTPYLSLKESGVDVQSIAKELKKYKPESETPQ